MKRICLQLTSNFIFTYSWKNILTNFIYNYFILKLDSLDTDEIHFSLSYKFTPSKSNSNLNNGFYCGYWKINISADINIALIVQQKVYNELESIQLAFYYVKSIMLLKLQLLNFSKLCRINLQLVLFVMGFWMRSSMNISIVVFL